MRNQFSCLVINCMNIEKVSQMDEYNGFWVNGNGNGYGEGYGGWSGEGCGEEYGEGKDLVCHRGNGEEPFFLFGFMTHEYIEG